MNPAITWHAVRDRALGMAIGAIAIAATLVWTVDIYANIDVSFYYDLPAPALELLGLEEGGSGLGGIAYGAMLYMMGGMTLGGIAISIGASSIAGEERDGTLGVLLGNPVGRLQVFGSKLVAMTTLVVAGGLVMWLGGVLAPDIVGVDIGDTNVTAMMVHLVANALLWGSIAAGISSATGNRSAAGGGTAGLMVVSYFVATLVGLFSWGEGIAKASPWWWFSGHKPDLNGIAWGWLGLQVAVIVAAVVVGRIGLTRRDLRAGGGRTSLLDKLKQDPRLAKLLARVGGKARTSSLQARIMGERRINLIVCAEVLLVMGFYFTALYQLLPDGFVAAFQDLPDSLMAMIGQADMATPAGFLQGEMYSLTLPITATAVLVTHGANALAGEEKDHTLGILLGNPVSRTRVLVAKAVAMVVHGLALGVAAVIGVAIGVWVFDFGIDLANLAAATLLAVVMSIGFGAIAFVVSAATGRVRRGVLTAASVAGVTWFANSFLALSEGTEWLAQLSPWNWALASDPLNTGLHVGDLLWLLVVPVVCFAVAVPLFNRRDLRG